MWKEYILATKLTLWINMFLIAWPIKNIVAYTANSTKPINRKLRKYVLDERRVSVRVLFNMWCVVVVGEQVDMQFYCRNRLTAK